MLPRIRSGDTCTIRPLGDHVLSTGDIVLCQVGGRQYLHKVSALRPGQVQISNNRGRVNGWTNLSHVYGLLEDVAR